MLLSNYAIIPGLQVEKAGPGDRAGIESMLADITCELAKSKRAQVEASERHAILVQSVRELEERTARGESELQKESAEVSDEVLGNSECAVTDYAMRLLPKQQTVLVLKKARDLGKYFRVPGALEYKLVTALDLRRLEATEAALYAALANVDTQERLEQSGIFESEKHIFIVGERTQNLRAAAKQLHTESQLLERELNETRARQLIAQQTRLAAGVITSEQVSTAISTHQGILT
jgi:propanediol utilization protein